MKRMIQAGLACLCLLLMGCPLQTDTPILGDMVIAIPKWLPGRWTEVKDGHLTGNTYYARLVPADSSKLMIAGLDKDGNPDADNMREAVVCSVKKQLFISIYDKGDDEKNSPGYYHYAISRSKDGDLQLVPLVELLVSSTTSSEDLSDYITQHAGTSDYLDRDATELFRKVPETGPQSSKPR